MNKLLFAAVAAVSLTSVANAAEPLPLHGIFACTSPGKGGGAFTLVYDVPTGKGLMHEWISQEPLEFAIAMDAEGNVHFMHTNALGNWEDTLKPDGTFVVRNNSIPTWKDDNSSYCVRKG
jgi:hypothetical protein